MTCPACGSAAPEGSRFCPSCGRPFAATEAPTVMIDAPTQLSGVMTAPLTEFAPGAIVAGRYRIERMLGRGGMGVVYQAHDQRLDHAVALKFLPASLARDPRRLSQFHSEVRLARRISHPNVCRVYDIGDVDGHLFLSMEYIEGEDLAAALRRRGPYAEHDAVDLIRQICAGLAAVHAEGVLHRDLKPANIMINAAGHAQLMDFGIAAGGDLDESERITEGTPHYMAPEQLRGGAVSKQSDIYALGLVMYEIFTGRRLFESRTLAALSELQQNLGSDAPPGLGSIEPRLQDAVKACLHPDPARRPSSAAEAASMLQIVLLDARATRRRIFQILVQALPAIAGFFALSAMARGASVPAAVVLTALAAVMVFIELKFPLGWTVDYKGHTIRFSNHPLWGERLLIDGKLADRGRFGKKVTLRGTIERGAAAGERITADVSCGFSSLSCRIVAEAFSAAPATAGSSV